MRSAESGRWKPFTSAFNPGQTHLWPCSDATVCQLVRRSAAFSPRLIRLPSSPCAPCFSKTCWLALWEKRSSQAGCSTGKGTTISSSMWMGHARQRALALCHKRRIGPPRSGVCAPCAPPATRDANEEKWCAAGPRFCRRIRISFSARLETPAMGNTEQNCVGQSRPYKARRVTHHHPEERVLLRLDGQYGTGAVLADLAGLPFVMRGKAYHLLKCTEIQVRLKLPPDQHLTHPESGMVRALYDCPAIPVGPEGVLCRVVVATHPAGEKKSSVGVTRAGVVYELFFSRLPQQAFTASDIVELYLHRGAFETALADEDQEQDPDRWASHTATGQECWQIVSQWLWNAPPGN